MIPIPIVGGRALIFNLDDIKELRDLGVVGILSGTLSMASQQNVFLGVPLQLMREEVVWLVTHKKGYLVPSEMFYKNLKASITEEEMRMLKTAKEVEFKRQTEEKEEQLKKKFEKLNIVRKSHKGTSSLTNFFYEIPDCPKDQLGSYKTFQKFYDKEELQETLLAQFVNQTGDETLKGEQKLNYAIYSALKEKNYFIAPGLRFGGKFILYPGDPLRYHSHLIVNSKDYQNDDIDLNSIVNGGRLATLVKKVWLLGGEDEAKDEVKFFSVEWSGFG